MHYTAELGNLGSLSGLTLGHEWELLPLNIVRSVLIWNKRRIFCPSQFPSVMQMNYNAGIIWSMWSEAHIVPSDLQIIKKKHLMCVIWQTCAIST